MIIDILHTEPYVLEFEYNNTDYVLINIHYKCCDGSEERRLQASSYFKIILMKIFQISMLLLLEILMTI